MGDARGHAPGIPLRLGTCGPSEGTVLVRAPGQLVWNCESSFRPLENTEVYGTVSVSLHEGRQKKQVGDLQFSTVSLPFNGGAFMVMITCVS